MADLGYAQNYQYLNELLVTDDKGDELLLWFGPGINSISLDKSETTTEEYYYDGDGNAETSVDGLSQSLTIEGARRYGDPAQDYVASLADETGDALIGKLRQTDPDGRAIERDVTIHEINAGVGGAANEKAKFSCKLSFLGAPRTVRNSDGITLPEEVECADVTVKVGETAEAKATVTPEDANPRCRFATGDRRIATVTPDGKVTGVKAGTTMVTVKCASKPSVSKQIKVTVTADGGEEQASLQSDTVSVAATTASARTATKAAAAKDASAKTE